MSFSRSAACLSGGALVVVLACGWGCTLPAAVLGDGAAGSGGDAHDGVVWQVAIGDDREDAAFAAAFDGAGNAVVAGLTTGVVSFGSFTSHDGANAFVAEIGPDGSERFWRDSHTAVDAASHALATSLTMSDGNVVVGGMFAGTVGAAAQPDPLDPVLTVTAGEALLIDKRLNEGDLIWRKEFGGGPGSDQTRALAAAPNGTLVVAGTAQNDITFATGLTLASNGNDGFWVRLDSNGIAQAFRAISSAAPLSSQIPRAVAVDGAGNVIVGGEFRGALDLSDCPPGDPLSTAAGTTAAFVVKYDPFGACVWYRALDAGTTTSVTGLAIAGDAIIVAGTYLGGHMFGTSGLPYYSQRAGFVAELDANGIDTWKAGFAGPNGAVALNAVAQDELTGVIVAVGSLQGTVTFPGGVVRTAVEGDDALVLSLQANGDFRWVRSHGGMGLDAATGVALGWPGVLVTGSFAHAIDFGAASLLTSAGLSDAFAALLPK